MDDPTKTSAGLAVTPSMFGQTFVTPLMATEPVVGAWWQSSATDTAVTAPAVTLKVPEPRQVETPSVAVPLSVRL